VPDRLEQIARFARSRRAESQRIAVAIEQMRRITVMKQNLLITLAASMFVLTFFATAQSAPELKRTPIATVELSPKKTVEHVQITRLDFQPGQITPRHLHPVPVIGYVESGAFIVQIQGQPQRRYGAGEIIYEPANTAIVRYDNESSKAPAVIIAYYLAGPDDKVLIKLLPLH
jgi:quercetin dioxygenase-like cupin family protein